MVEIDAKVTARTARRQLHRFIKQMAAAWIETGEEAVDVIRFQTDIKDRL